MTAISRRIRSLPPGQSVVTIRLVAEPGREGAERDRQIGRIDAEARQRAARAQHAQRRLERRLRAERLDRDVDAAAVGQAHDLLDRVDRREIDDMVGAELLRDRQPRRQLSTPMIVVAPISLRAGRRRTGRSGPARRPRPYRRSATLPLSAPAKPVDMMSGHISTCSSVRRSGIGARLAIASGTSTYSAWQPSIVLPKRQPPIALKPCGVPAPSCEWQPHKAGVDCARSA